MDIKKLICTVQEYYTCMIAPNGNAAVRRLVKSVGRGKHKYAKCLSTGGYHRVSRKLMGNSSGNCVRLYSLSQS